MEEVTLGQNIRRIRQERGMTQKALADAAFGEGNQAQLSRYETGTWTPNVENLVRIARALNCQLSDLIYVAHSKQEAS